MGTGPSNAFPVWSSLTVPGVSDFARISGNFAFNTVPPAMRALRFDTSLVGDSAWHNCRVYAVQYDVSAQDGVGAICPDIHAGAATADTFTIPTTGIYHLAAIERFIPASAGVLQLRWITTGTSTVLVEDSVPYQPSLAYYNARAETDHYLTAGTQLNVQHFSNTTVTLDTTSPTPFISIRYVGRLTV